MGLKIISTGSAIPEKIVTNADFEKSIDTTDEWIRKRTGIEQRRFAKGVDVSGLAEKSARIALNRALESGLDKPDIKLVIAASFTSEIVMPSISSYLTNELELGEEVFSVDINMACTGFVGALRIADGLLAEGQSAIVVASEVISKHLNPEDRSTLVLFGDGAGAVIVKKTADQIHFDFGTVPGYENLTMNAKGLKEQDEYLRMNGKEVFRFAAKYVPLTVENTLENYGICPEQIEHYIFHQANKRILEHVAKVLGISEERFYMNLNRLANTSAASIPLVLDEMNGRGLLNSGDRLLLVGFGSGLSYCSTVLKW